jgi:hypothetical protein
MWKEKIPCALALSFIKNQRNGFIILLPICI